MIFKDKKAEAFWQSGLRNNQDPYGMGCFTFAETWANLMEKKVTEGMKVKDVAEVTSHEADTEGITGFMFSAAASILCHCWIHGDELKKWRLSQ